MRPRNSGLQRWPFLNVAAQGTFLAAYFGLVVPIVMIILAFPISYMVRHTAARVGISITTLAVILAVVYLASFVVMSARRNVRARVRR